MTEHLTIDNSARLLHDLRQELLPLLQRIASHRYVQALEEGRVPREALQVLAAQQYHIVSKGPQHLAIMLARYGHLPSRKKLNEFLQAEIAVGEALLDFAGALSMREADLLAAPMRLDAQLFSFCVGHICQFGSDAELIAAFYFDAQVWIANALRISRALQTRYGLRGEALRFFDMYANYKPNDEDVLPYIQRALERGASLGQCPGCKPDEQNVQHALDRGVAAAQIRESARLLIESELRFWDDMATAAGV